MPTRAFSIEDGNIGTNTLVSSRTETYKDIDLTFTKKASGDIFKKKNMLLLSNKQLRIYY